MRKSFSMVLALFLILGNDCFAKNASPVVGSVLFVNVHLLFSSYCYGHDEPIGIAGDSTYPFECKNRIILLEVEDAKAECLNYQFQKEIERKVARMTGIIASEKKACCVISYWPNIEPFVTYVDPAYDITQEVADRLNAEYKIGR